MAKNKKAWYWCSRYCRLRDAINYCKEMGIDTSQFARVEDLPVKCCTCKKIKSWIYMDAGHCISRGLGGGSGVYYDERNIATQSKDCNAFRQGARPEFEVYLKAKYGDKIMDELTFKDRTHRYSWMEIDGLELFYKAEYKKLVGSI